jgi:hypothetical protein
MSLVRKLLLSVTQLTYCLPSSCVSNQGDPHRNPLRRRRQAWQASAIPPPPHATGSIPPSRSLHLRALGSGHTAAPPPGTWRQACPNPQVILSSTSSPRSANCFYSLLLFVAACWRHGMIRPASWAGMGWIFARLLVVTIT